MWGKCKQQKTITEGKGKILQPSLKTGWNVQNYLNSQGKSRLLSPQVSYMN